MPCRWRLMLQKRKIARHVNGARGSGNEHYWLFKRREPPPHPTPFSPRSKNSTEKTNKQNQNWSERECETMKTRRKHKLKKHKCIAWIKTPRGKTKQMYSLLRFMEKSVTRYVEAHNLVLSYRVRLPNQQQSYE